MLEITQEFQLTQCNDIVYVIEKYREVVRGEKGGL